MKQWSKIDTNMEMVEKPRRYLSEEDILRNPLDIDLKTVTDARLSRLYLHGQTTFALNDTINVRIETYDSYGNRRTGGGDYFRLWMEERGLGASVTGDVMDHNNGSYTGIFRAVWAGTPTIFCHIEKRKEEIALIYRKYHQYDTLWSAHADFFNGVAMESTLCFTRPMPPAEYCDLAAHNGDLPYYCVRPLHPDLNCSMLVNTWTYRRRIPMSPIEKLIYDLSRDTEQELFVQNITVNISKGPENQGVLSSKTSPPCSAVSPRATWRVEAPSGFFYRGAWISRLCVVTIPITEPAYRACLKNRNLWIPGDSTSIQIFMEMNNVLRAAPVVPRTHEPKVLFHPHHNYSVHWEPHEFPYFPGLIHYPKTYTKPESHHFDKIPNNSRDIIVLYMNTHFIVVHQDVYRLHVRKLVSRTRTLMQRAPNVVVAVRGPHAYFRQPYHEMYSYWGLVFRDILHEEFRPLKDRVIFLDFWDMTSALGLPDFHPPPAVVQTITNTMMGYLCRD
ncbi:NXPE family member 4-like [Haliotis rubra]|uniref:NXPE family member 4-like n=1 Tax=Haliotis rubra TaxID=36100 RepID=UPI001EE59433|nr:NXPE family member 4-like [Haliotis rubra]